MANECKDDNLKMTTSLGIIEERYKIEVDVLSPLIDFVVTTKHANAELIDVFYRIENTLVAYLTSKVWRSRDTWVIGFYNPDPTNKAIITIYTHEKIII